MLNTHWMFQQMHTYIASVEARYFSTSKGNWNDILCTLSSILRFPERPSSASRPWFGVTRLSSFEPLVSIIPKTGGPH
jgi:hypothetical protein